MEVLLNILAEALPWACGLFLALYLIFDVFSKRK